MIDGPVYLVKTFRLPYESLTCRDFVFAAPREFESKPGFDLLRGGMSLCFIIYLGGRRLVRSIASCLMTEHSIPNALDPFFSRSVHNIALFVLATSFGATIALLLKFTQVSKILIVTSIALRIICLTARHPGFEERWEQET